MSYPGEVEIKTPDMILLCKRCYIEVCVKEEDGELVLDLEPRLCRKECEVWLRELVKDTYPKTSQ